MKKQELQSFLEEEGKIKREEMDPWALLLKDIKVTKDPLDGKDIWLNKVEVEIIDSQDFQRLREISQIPFADFIYIGATHTRFEHSIGTLYMIQSMIDNINKNAVRWEHCEKLSSRDIFITRVVGLIHDLAHLTYPHILEDGAIFKEKQWADKDRIKKFLSENTKIYSIIEENIKEVFKKCKRPWEGAFKEAIEDIKESVRIIEEGVEGVKREVVFADIVGNTVCADILDYIPRDILHTGLSGKYDDRILSYFVVKKIDGKRRVVLRLYKDDEYRDSVLSSYMQILDLRYQLASKVYYHHTRRKARAMAAEMVGESMLAGILDKKGLLEMGGIALREYILNFEKDKLNSEEKKKHLKIAKSLANDLKNRQLYEILHEVRIVDLRAKERIREIQEEWEKRHKTEREIEELFGLEPGSILIFAPIESMEAKKTLGTLVEIPIVWGSIVKTFDELNEDDFPDEYRDVYEVINKTKKIIIRKHELLWKLSVYARRDVDEQKKEKVKTLVDQWFRGAPPVTAVEALAEQKGIKVTPTSYTEIATHTNKALVGAFPSKSHSSKSLFTQALDIAISNFGERNEKGSR